jgi:hypothetical protein
MTTLRERVASACATDGEFLLAARFWTGSLRIDLGREAFELVIHDGRIVEARPPDGDPPGGAGHLGFAGPAEVWDAVLSAVPPPYFNDIVPATALGLSRTGEDETFWQYYPAVRRVIELLRADRAETAGRRS